MGPYYQAFPDGGSIRLYADDAKRNHDEHEYGLVGGNIFHPRGRRGLRHPRHAGGPGRDCRPPRRPENRPPQVTAPSQARTAVTAMLEARSVALVGASARPGSLGARMIEQVARSPSRPRTYLVNPRYAEIGGVPCLPDLGSVPEPVDLALLAVPDSVLEAQVGAAAQSRARSVVIFGNAFDPPGRTGLRSRLAAAARASGLAVCGAGCMGFVNVARGLRAVGYLEPDPLPAGPVALVTHSGSVFSALLRARRGFGFTVAVSSGQELVTTAADYAGYALGLPQTRVLALVLEAIRDGDGLRAVLASALAKDVPVVLLSVGGSEAGKALVSAHSGALAAADGAWEALAAAYGLHRVRDLAELADTLELFADRPARRRRHRPGKRPGNGPGDGHCHRARLGPGARARRRPGRRDRRAVRLAEPGHGAPARRGARPGPGPGQPRWTCEGPAATPSRCSPSACPRWPPTHGCPRSRWPSA